MSFNEPLIKLQNLTLYKLWLIDFNLDIDCLSLIKKLTYQIGMKRPFVPPTPEELNRGVFSYKINNKLSWYYINHQGIVFRVRDTTDIPTFHTQCGIELYTYKM